MMVSTMTLQALHSLQSRKVYNSAKMLIQCMVILVDGWVQSLMLIKQRKMQRVSILKKVFNGSSIEEEAMGGKKGRGNGI